MERNDGGCFRDPENQDAANCIHHIHGYVSSRNGPLRNEAIAHPETARWSLILTPECVIYLFPNGP